MCVHLKLLCVSFFYQITNKQKNMTEITMAFLPSDIDPSTNEFRVQSALTFDIVTSFDIDTEEKTYFGMVHLSYFEKSKTYDYKVYGCVTKNVIAGTSDTDSFSFPIASLKEDYFVMVSSIVKTPQNTSPISKWGIVTPERIEVTPEKKNTFAIFYPLKVLKERKVRIDKSKNRHSNLRHNSVPQTPPPSTRNSGVTKPDEPAETEIPVTVTGWPAEFVHITSDWDSISKPSFSFEDHKFIPNWNTSEWDSEWNNDTNCPADMDLKIDKFPDIAASIFESFVAADFLPANSENMDSETE